MNDAEGQSAAFAEAKYAWFSGDGERCLELTEGLAAADDAAGGEIAILRLRALLRVGMPQRALDELLRSEVAADDSASSLTIRMLTGAAYLALNDTDRALSVLCAVERDAVGAVTALQSEVALQVALVHVARRDLRAACLALDRVERETDIVDARAYECRGWIAYAEGEFGRAASIFTGALRRLDACASYDRFVAASCLQALSVIGLERLDRTVWAAVREHRSKIDWSPQSLRHAQFLVALNAAGFAYDVDGDPVEAAAEARLAERVAPSAAHRAWALSVRACIARRAHESVAQRDHLQAAIEAFAARKPPAFDGYETTAPLSIAEELAGVGRAEEARSFFELFRRRTTSPTTNADARPAAGYELLVQAQVLAAEGHSTEALSAYRHAFALFRRIGCPRGSLVAALRIAQAVPDDQYLWGHIDVAATNIARSSWIHDEIRALRRTALGVTLTPLQKEYLRLLCSGKSNPEIARIRNRSVHTVRNQIVPLFEIFGVQSRSELVATCLRSGVLDDAPESGRTASR